MDHSRRRVGLAVVTLVTLAAGAAVATAPAPSTTAVVQSAGVTASPDDVGSTLAVDDTGAANETPARLGLGSGPVVAETASPATRLGTAVAVGDDELRVRFARYRARELLDSATADTERRAAVRQVLDETSRAADRLRDREAAAVRAYRSDAIDRPELFRRLATVHLVAAEHRRTLTELQQRAEGSLTFELETEFSTLTRRLRMFQSPPRARLTDGVTGNSVSDVRVSTTETGLALETIVDGTYVREVVRLDRYDAGGEQLGTTRDAVDRLGVLYPYAFAASRSHSISAVERRLFLAEFPHPQGQVRAYLNRATGEIYREVQRLQLDQVPTRSVVNRTVEGVTVTVDRVDGQDPTRISLTDSATGDPVDATVGVGNRTVGTTEDGRLWLVLGATPTAVSLDTDGRTVTVTVGDTETRANTHHDTAAGP